MAASNLMIQLLRVPSGGTAGPMEWLYEVHPAVCLPPSQGWQGADAQGRSDHSKHGVTFPLAYSKAFRNLQLRDFWIQSWYPRV